MRSAYLTMAWPAFAQRKPDHGMAYSQGIQMVKFPTNGQPQVFRALIAGTSPVAVERPETIQYFNNMVRRRRASSGIRV